MFLSSKNTKFFYNSLGFFSTGKLRALDEYWSNNKSHPTHQQIHEVIEIHLIQSGEKTFKQIRLFQIRKLERAYSISNPMGRFSANIIGLITKLLISTKLIKVN